MENLCSFGDADNDYEMTLHAGVGVVMANGSEKTKSVADYITDDNNLKDFAKGQTRITLIKADGNVIFEGSGVEMSEKTVEYIKNIW